MSTRHGVSGRRVRGGSKRGLTMQGLAPEGRRRDQREPAWRICKDAAGRARLVFRMLQTARLFFSVYCRLRPIAAPLFRLPSLPGAYLGMPRRTLGGALSAGSSPGTWKTAPGLMLAGLHCILPTPACRRRSSSRICWLAYLANLANPTFPARTPSPQHGDRFSSAPPPRPLADAWHAVSASSPSGRLQQARRRKRKRWSGAGDAAERRGEGRRGRRRPAGDGLTAVLASKQ